MAALAVGCIPFGHKKAESTAYPSLHLWHSAPSAETEYTLPPDIDHVRSARDPAAKRRRELRLAEAVRIAVSNNANIVTLGFTPGIRATEIQRIWGHYDAVFSAGGGWVEQKQPQTINISTFGTGSKTSLTDTFGLSAQNGGFGSYVTNGSVIEDPGYPGQAPTPGRHTMLLEKRNLTGGTTFVSYDIGYQFYKPSSNQFVLINPSWTSLTTVGIVQPLLLGAGVDYNRALILIERANHQRAIHDFEQDVQTLVRDVVTGYWDLYLRYQDLRAAEVGLEKAMTTLDRVRDKAARGLSAGSEEAESRAQFELFRADRVEALVNCLNAERHLRRLLGLATEDGDQLVPVDSPLVGDFSPDWALSLATAMAERPLLGAQRANVHAAHLLVSRRRRGLLPDVSFNANYGLNAVANSWNSSLDLMFQNQFQNWNMGIAIKSPIGKRSAHAQLQRAKLELSQEQARLHNQELGIQHELYDAYQRLVGQYEIVHIRRERTKATLAVRDSRERMRSAGEGTSQLVLDSQKDYVDSLRDEARAVVAYNKALADWLFAQGAILREYNVEILERTDPRGKHPWHWGHGLMHRPPLIADDLPDGPESYAAVLTEAHSPPAVSADNATSIAEPDATKSRPAAASDVNSHMPPDPKPIRSLNDPEPVEVFEPLE